MIDSIHEISNDNGYKTYSTFAVSEELKDILYDNYYMYGASNYDKKELSDDLYQKNFYDKYDKNAYAEVYSKYIDNEKFKNKAKFIYSIVDIEKYEKFVELNPNIKNPNDFVLNYNIVDSDGTKVEVYNISIVDISFVF